MSYGGWFGVSRLSLSSSSLSATVRILTSSWDTNHDSLFFSTMHFRATGHSSRYPRFSDYVGKNYSANDLGLR